MCLICDGQDDENRTEVYVVCAAVTKIPANVYWTKLVCRNCPNLTQISPYLPNLTELSCYHCPLLTQIPSTLTNLHTLRMSNCPLLITIPPTYTSLRELYSTNNIRLTAPPLILPFVTEFWFWSDDTTQLISNRPHFGPRAYECSNFPPTLAEDTTALSVIDNLRHYYIPFTYGRTLVEYCYSPHQVGGRLSKRSIALFF